MLSKWLKSLFKNKKTPPSEKTDLADGKSSVGVSHSSQALSSQASNKEQTNYQVPDNRLEGEKNNQSVTKSRRSSDMAAEQELAIFLDSCLYRPLLREGRFS